MQAVTTLQNQSSRSTALMPPAIVRRRGGPKRALGTRAPMLVPQWPNDRWSLDFVADQFIDARRLRIPGRGRRLHPRMPGAFRGRRLLRTAGGPPSLIAGRHSRFIVASCHRAT
jgi:hypothetical protein